MSESRVREFYSGKNFFITGGSGFVGVTLIEKLLRVVPDVGNIYLLLRPKRGKDASQRLQDIAKNSVFETLLKTASPDVFKKLIAVAGDVGKENLGLSAQDRQTLIDNVNVVVHSAATLDFTDHLRETVTINLLGTRRVLDLCKQCKNLKVMIQVSSTYANSFLYETEEQIYEAPADADYVVSLLDKMDDNALLEIEPKLLGKHPNTYTFTKHLAEHEVKKCSDLFPCTIVRPSIILGSWKEPTPGWTIAKTGLQGFLMGASKGVVRRVPVIPGNVMDQIPVDVVINQLLVSGYDTAVNKSGLKVYHSSTSTCRPFRFSQIEAKINRYLTMYPLMGAIWYPYMKFIPSVWMFRISVIFIHFLPAYILDTVLRLTGGRPILVRLHRNVWNSLILLKPFIEHEWFYHNTKAMQLNKTLNETDQKLFFTDPSDLDWEDFLINLMLGVRKYLHHEREETLPAARGKHTLLLIFHILLQLAIVVGFWWLIASILGMTMSQTAWAAPAVYILYSQL